MDCHLERPNSAGPGPLLFLISLGLFTLWAAPAGALEPADVTAILRNPARASDYPGAGGIWLALDRRVEIDGAGRIHGFDHRLARVFDPAWGRDQFSYFVRTYDGEHQSVRVLRARVWHSQRDFVDLPEEAVRHEPSARSGGVEAYAKLVDLTVRFGELPSGSTVEILTEFADQPQSGDLNIRSFEHVYGSTEPVVEQQLHLQIPSASKSVMESIGRVVRQPKKIGALRAYDWLTGDLDALPDGIVDGLVSRSREPGATGADSLTVTVYAGTIWEYLSGHYGRQWQGELADGDPDISVAVGEIVGQAVSSKERALAIERYVQEEVRTLPIPHQLVGMKPVAPGRVFRSRAGAPRDKALLLTALLSASGIRGEPVLVRTRTGPWLRDLAAPEQLDRFLVRVPLPDGASLWCDPIESRTALLPSEGLILVLEASTPEVGLIGYPGRLGSEAGY